MRTEAGTSRAHRDRDAGEPPTLWCEPAPEPREPTLVEGELVADLDVSIRVLASSSSGNCTLMIRGAGATKRLTLIDAGLTPRRTLRMLTELGYRADQIDDIIFTHLDRDHCAPTWAQALPSHARFRIHRAHRQRAERMGLLVRRTYIFDDLEPAQLPDGITVHCAHASHDQLGVAVFRFHVAGCETPALGFATDVGRVSRTVTDHLAGVHTLAIESNYCPEMQRRSGRPAYLINRIMNGSGHLSNEESARAVAQIGPTGQTVLLHLSQQCNSPEVARSHHGPRTIVAPANEPTDEIVVTRRHPS